MGFRTIVVKSRSKLEYSLNYMICRNEEVKRVLIDEISVVIIQSTTVSLTAALLSELIKHKVKVIFCDEKSNPLAELMPYANSFASSARIKEQINWNPSLFGLAWQTITIEKIKNQAMVLGLFLHDDTKAMLLQYASEVTLGDATNREGHAAKVYFNSLFGKSFYRGDESNKYNAYLNYGYSIILSAINREITASGYLTQLGIHHIGETNPFNLGCDFMEPLRPLVDKLALDKDTNEDNFKEVMSKILSLPCKYNEMETYMDNAIKLYVNNLLSFLSGRTDNISFIECL